MKAWSQALRMFVEAQPRMCPACGSRYSVREYEQGTDLTWRVYAICHGSIERHEVDMERMRYNEGAVFDKLAAWFRDLFKLDALPDVRELLHYNRGTLPTPAR